MKINKRLKTAGLLLPLIILLSDCSPKLKDYAPPATDKLAVIDYSLPDTWAAHPIKNDPSDNVPAPLRDTYRKDSSVDVFFVHPTTYTKNGVTEWNASLQDADLNKKTDQSTILLQASAFNEYNVYAPRYRQAHIQSYFSRDTSKARQALRIAYEDVRAAFLYYLKNLNNGRPVIIASHSQGTTHTKLLLKEFFEGKALQEKLVAAYLIGIPLEPDYFSELKPCADSLQTGCFVGWRTFRKGFEPDYDPRMRQSIVTNPLTWTNDTVYAPVQLHKGAVLRNFNKLFPSVNDAVVHKDLLWVSRPEFPGSRLYRSKNYHIGDINLFYVNIRANLRQRVEAYNKRGSINQ